MASVRQLIHSGYMAKQREAMGLDKRGKWRLLSGMTDMSILHEIRPLEAKNSSQAPLVQRVKIQYTPRALISHLFLFLFLSLHTIGWLATISSEMFPIS